MNRCFKIQCKTKVSRRVVDIGGKGFHGLLQILLVVLQMKWLNGNVTKPWCPVNLPSTNPLISGISTLFPCFGENLSGSVVASKSSRI